MKTGRIGNLVLLAVIVTLIVLPAGMAMMMAEGSGIRAKIGWIVTQAPSGGLALAFTAIGLSAGIGLTLAMMFTVTIIGDLSTPSGDRWTSRDQELFDTVWSRLSELSYGEKVREEDLTTINTMLAKLKAGFEGMSPTENDETNEPGEEEEPEADKRDVGDVGPDTADTGPEVVDLPTPIL